MCYSGDEAHNDQSSSNNGLGECKEKVSSSLEVGFNKL